MHIVLYRNCTCPYHFYFTFNSAFELCFMRFHDVISARSNGCARSKTMTDRQLLSYMPKRTTNDRQNSDGIKIRSAENKCVVPTV